MPKYASPRYPELGFYVDGSFCRFCGGFFVAESEAEIAVLDELADVVRVDEPEEVTADKAEKPVKAPASRKSSVK
ncbi:hypothetical protein BBD42_15600 [Paenibacillus sp. BIHB 4019]|uniref:Uncharacterized protein n=1 Tax=Paenibacillus sp. BIHB 4019 TaxID=1870819 RepID=A0A1B2DJ62_9BACL|nr:hypothetical protein [Paenibacillus sp. BIHB 4019]ANY67731.1 hypothetical protein BBD42_15600 [Paenibacillus sp. BIHB 4019]